MGMCSYCALRKTFPMKLCGAKVCMVSWGQNAMCWVLGRQGYFFLAGVFTGWNGMVNMVSSYYWTFVVYPQFAFSYIAGFGCLWQLLYSL